MATAMNGPLQGVEISMVKAPDQKLPEYPFWS